MEKERIGQSHLCSGILESTSVVFLQYCAKNNADFSHDPCEIDALVYQSDRGQNIRMFFDNWKHLLLSPVNNVSETIS